MEWGGVSFQEESTTINCASYWWFLTSLNGKTPIDGKSAHVQVDQGDQSYLSVYEAPNTTSNNVGRKIRTLYLT